MDQRDDNILLFEVPVKARAAANQLIDFSGDLNAAEACSHDNEAEMSAPPIGIAGSFSLFHLTHDMLSKVNGIAHDLEGERMLGHSGDDTEVAFRSAGDHHVIVVQASEHSGPIVKFDLRGGKIDPLNAFGTATNTREHLAQRCCGRVRIDGGS